MTDELHVSSVPDAELTLDSLRRRVRAMFTLYDDAIATMDVDQVNHFERDGVVPIAFSLFHITNMIDTVFELMTGVGPIWSKDWSARLQMTIDDHGKERTVAEMVHQRIGDYDEYQRYQRAVFTRVAQWLAGLRADRLSRIVVPRPFGASVSDTFSARVAGPRGITLLDAIECWIYQHGLRHMGEIEHARGLVGLQGMTS